MSNSFNYSLIDHPSSLNLLYLMSSFFSIKNLWNVCRSVMTSLYFIAFSRINGRTNFCGLHGHLSSNCMRIIYVISFLLSLFNIRASRGRFHECLSMIVNKGLSANTLNREEKNYHLLLSLELFERLLCLELKRIVISDVSLWFYLLWN